MMKLPVVFYVFYVWNLTNFIFFFKVPVQFEFIKKLDDSSYCKDWLHIEPYTGFIMPGEINNTKYNFFNE